MCVHYVYIVWIAGLLCLLLEEVWSGVARLDRRVTQCLGQVQTLLRGLFLVCVVPRATSSLASKWQQEGTSDVISSTTRICCAFIVVKANLFARVEPSQN